ncbi:hypothetical protein C4573_01195 [Candidatus Woesearchaeota archaeon]|nr:MAG: hypothetical protein C4573_01195 [Candidatus Woesearchaeota archaeon]
MGKRGQVTIFVILGIVLIAAFAFVFYAKFLLLDSNLQSQTDKSVRNFVRDTSLNNYVSTCLLKVGHNGIEQIALQGGYLYDYQQGPINTSPFVQGVDYLPFNYSNQSLNVSYAIYANDICPIVQQYPWQYPYPSTYMNQLNITYRNFLINTCSNFHQQKSGFFGSNNLSRMCNFFGVNAYQTTNISALRFTCDPFHYNSFGQTSMQEQLEYYTQKHLPNCTNFSKYNQLTGYNVTLLDNASVKVYFGAKDITFYAEYPFEILVNGQPKTVFYQFTAKSDAQLKDLYTYVFDLVTEDVQNPFFNKTKDHYFLHSYKTSYLYQEYRNACPLCINATFDDIIVIADNESIVNGKPLTFIFSIVNRRPALEYLHDPTLTFFNTTTDLLYLENDTINLSPQGYDPDELDLYYNYSLWKETYDEYFDFSCCNVFGGSVNCTVNFSQCNVKIPSVQPQNWTNSTAFQLTKRNASYQTNRSDTGFHIVNISVSDRQNLVDYQEVRITIFDRPLAVINVSNAYADINDSHASIEDVYFLEANNSRHSAMLYGTISSFLWQDLLENFSINTTNVTVLLPNETFHIDESLAISIQPIPYTLANIARYFNETGARNVSLVVFENTIIGIISSLPAYEEIEVFACLPHRDSAPSWPYNMVQNPLYSSINQDPFQANHTCCYNGSDGGSYGTIKSSANICYTIIEYGAVSSFAVIPGAHISYNPPSTDPSLNYAYLNDIFKRDFERNCSGLRGNTCTGPASETRIHPNVYDTTKACLPDIFDSASITHFGAKGYINTGPAYTQTETCSGPTMTTAVPDPAAVSCTLYNPPESFESNFGLKDANGNAADGMCNEQGWCATNTGASGGYFKAPSGYTAPYNCTSQCNNGYCDYPTSCFCEQSCGSDPFCHQKPSGYAASFTDQNPLGQYKLFSTGVQSETGCGNSCNKLTCSPYTFNANALICNTKNTATSSQQCDDGYVFDPTTKKCVACLNNKETYGDTPNGLCEDGTGNSAYACDADSACDEKNTGAVICSGKLRIAICNSACKYQQTAFVCSSACGAHAFCNGKAPNACVNVGFLDMKCNSGCAGYTYYYGNTNCAVPWP